jgi:hypothetical protein
MRIWSRQFAIFSINIGGQYSFWRAFSELQKKHLCALQLANCVQFWTRVFVAAVASRRFRFWLGLSLGYGLDSLIRSFYSFLVHYPWRKVGNPLFIYLA